MEKWFIIKKSLEVKFIVNYSTFSLKWGKKTVTEDAMSVYAGSYRELFQASFEVATFQRTGILSNNLISKEIMPQQLECPPKLTKYDIAALTSLKLSITNSIRLRWIRWFW